MPFVAMSGGREPPQWENAIVASVAQAVAAIPYAVSLLIGAGGAAYILGWVTARAYYSRFAAEWVLTELSSTSVGSLAIFCLFVATVTHGRAAGTRDVDANQSLLPRVLAAGHTEGDLRLLTVSAGRFYVAELTKESRIPKIFVFDASQVLAVVGTKDEIPLRLTP